MLRLLTLRTLVIALGGAVVVLAVVLIVLNLHGEAKLGKGTVVGKIDTPAYDSTWLMPVYTGQICSGTGTSRVCTSTYSYIPMPEHHSETWKLQIQAKGTNGKLKKGVWYVSQGVFEQVKIGSYFDKDQGGLASEPGVVKETKKGGG